MAILQEPEEPTEAAATSKPKGLRKALRTGTTSYMSMHVLYGGSHTYFDDMAALMNVWPSKLEPSYAESTGSSSSSTVDPVSAIGADLEEAFDRMWKNVFAEEPHGLRSKYEDLAQYWVDAIRIKKAAVHTLAFAQQEIKNVESQLSLVGGPELVQYYRRAYYRVGGDLEGTNAALGRFKADILRAVDQLAIP
ncbi:hypothetical protein BU15DRAFT_80779 [Melanogaster broomeanus]|nr:hypothetical protein BU15DRAFT_80779 [Melanogaster broomeanus]